MITVSKTDQNLCASFQKIDHKEIKCAVSENSLLKTPVFKTLLIFAFLEPTTESELTCLTELHVA